MYCDTAECAHKLTLRFPCANLHFALLETGWTRRYSYLKLLAGIGAHALKPQAIRQVDNHFYHRQHTPATYVDLAS